VNPVHRLIRRSAYTGSPCYAFPPNLQLLDYRDGMPRFEQALRGLSSDQGRPMVGAPRHGDYFVQRKYINREPELRYGALL